MARAGARLPAAYPALPAGSRETARALGSGTLTDLLIALVVIITAARAAGWVFHRYLGQPRVIGEVIAGLMLGPSLLGRVAPGLSDALLPANVAPTLLLLAQLGVILFMFVVGLDLDGRLLREQARTAFAISQGSIVVPFLLGSGLALWLYPRFASADVPFITFALFLGVSLSVTAFPVLARIVTELGIERSTIGTLALSAAAVGDVTAWCLLAFVLGAAQADVHSAFWTLGLAAGYVALVLWFGPGLARRFAHRTDAATIVFLAVLLSALVTAGIGIHPLFGAFVVGAVIPRDSPLAQTMKRSVEEVVLVLLLPVFFVSTGLKTRIQLLDGGAAWATCGLILLAAGVGKIGGSAVAGRLTGLGWRDAGRVGILMNTRGLVELIVLNLGLDLGIISPTLFAMLVIMAVVTTLATAPLLRLMDGKGR